GLELVVGDELDVGTVVELLGGGAGERQASVGGLVDGVLGQSGAVEAGLSAAVGVLAYRGAGGAASAVLVGGAEPFLGVGDDGAAQAGRGRDGGGAGAGLRAEFADECGGEGLPLGVGAWEAGVLDCLC